MVDKRSAERRELVLSDESIVVVFAELESFRPFEEEFSVNGILHVGHGRDGEGYAVPCPLKDGIFFFWPLLARLYFLCLSKDEEGVKAI